MVAWKVSVWPGIFPGGLENFQVAWKPSTVLESFHGGLESFQVAWKVSTVALKVSKVAWKVTPVKSLEGIFTHQSHISQVFFRYPQSPE